MTFQIAIGKLKMTIMSLILLAHRLEIQTRSQNVTFYLAESMKAKSVKYRKTKLTLKIRE